MSVSVAAKNTTFENGEGPHWEEATQSLIYVDIMKGDVHRLNAATGQDTKLHVAGRLCFTFYDMHDYLCRFGAMALYT